MSSVFLQNDDIMPSSNDLKKRGSIIFETGYMSDCSFEVGEEKKIIKAHKIILIMASSVFKAMFDGPLANESIVKIQDASHESFEFFLRYVYTDELVMQSFDMIHRFCYLANKYFVPFPREICFNFLVQDLDNVCIAFDLARLLNFSDLIDKCIRIFQKETDKIFQGSGFLTAEPQTIEVIFKQNELNINNELELFHAIEKYANHNFEDNKDEKFKLSIKNCVKNIRFLAMFPKDFTDHVVNSNLLDQTEKLLILSNLCSKDFSNGMPEGFDTKDYSRKKAEILDLETSHLYCISRKLIKRATIPSKQSISSKFSFNSSDNSVSQIYLVGIVIRTKEKEKHQRVHYYEEIDIEVCSYHYDSYYGRHKEASLAKTALRQKVMLNSKVIVQFKLPIELKSTNKYLIKFTCLEQPYSLMCDTFNTTETMNNFTFHFDEAESVIHSFLFDVKK